MYVSLPLEAYEYYRSEKPHCSTSHEPKTGRLQRDALHSSFGVDRRNLLPAVPICRRFEGFRPRNTTSRVGLIEPLSLKGDARVESELHRAVSFENIPQAWIILTPTSCSFPSCLSFKLYVPLCFSTADRTSLSSRSFRQNACLSYNDDFLESLLLRGPCPITCYFSYVTPFFTSFLPDFPLVSPLAMLLTSPLVVSLGSL